MQNTVNERIKKIRLHFDEKQHEMAAKLKISSQAVSNMERRNGSINGETARKFADVYGVNLEWLLDGKGEMFLTTIEDQTAADKAIALLQQELDNKQRMIEWLQQFIDKALPQKALAKLEAALIGDMSKVVEMQVPLYREELEEIEAA